MGSEAPCSGGGLFGNCLLTEAYNPEAYNSVAELGLFREPIKIYFLIWNYW